MKTLIKNQDDIVFENRNKSYGAYFLRRRYNKIVTRALFFAVFFFLGIVSIPLIANYLHPVKLISDKQIIIFDPRLIPPPEKTVLPKLPEPINKLRLDAFRPPVVVSDPVDENIDISTLMEGTLDGVIDPTDDGALYIDETKGNVVIDQKPVEKPFTIVELMPAFIGGEEALYKWIGANIKYPIAARETGIHGTVIVTFVVEKDGSITGTQVLRDIGGGCGEEATRVINLMPKWREGRQNNLPVRVQFNLPIKFTLEE
jgi:protein TonB